jgi:hypothetical protein
MGKSRFRDLEELETIRSDPWRVSEFPESLASLREVRILVLRELRKVRGGKRKIVERSKEGESFELEGRLELLRVS